jgi:predicted nucleic acid-binding protein
MKIVADTSSLLSLEFMGILDDSFEITEVYITNTVEAELKEIASYKDEKSRLAKNVMKHIRGSKIKCIIIKNETFSKNLSRNVDAGEASCLALCILENISLLLTDDADAAYSLGRIAMQNRIKIRICVAVLMELIKDGKITKIKAIKKMRNLIKQRSWEGGVLEVLVMKYIDENEI